VGQVVVGVNEVGVREVAGKVDVREVAGAGVVKVREVAGEGSTFTDIISAIERSDHFLIISDAA